MSDSKKGPSQAPRPRPNETEQRQKITENTEFRPSTRVVENPSKSKSNADKRRTREEP